MEKSNRPIRVRFAPSPTGHLHVGGARTALYSYLFAKKHQGTFVLRIEDTDLERSTDESLRQQIADLKWLGLDWDEGLDPLTLADVGPHGPYRQSHRQSIYREHAERLLEAGKAYYCFMTDEEIERQREELLRAGQPPQVQSPYRGWSLSEAREKLAAGDPAAIRFRTAEPKREYVLKDLVRGEVRFPSDMVGDFVLLRSNGMPVYNFCCVIDDHLMQISHVLRAEEHLSNTVRQMMLYEAFDYPLPEFGHLSIILGSDRQKLSKRHGATSVNDYRLRGYLPEAMLNFLALLGWSSPEAQEILHRDDLINQFSLERLHAAPAVFDEAKLLWVNATHLRHLADDDLWRRLQPFLQEAHLDLPQDSEWQSRVLALFKSNMETLVDSVERFRPLATGPLAIAPEAAEVLAWESTPQVVQKWRDLVGEYPDPYMTTSDFQKIEARIKDECGVKGKFLFMPIRVAVIGRPQGAELRDLVPLLRREWLLARADRLLEKISHQPKK